MRPMSPRWWSAAAVLVLAGCATAPGISVGPAPPAGYTGLPAHATPEDVFVWARLDAGPTFAVNLCDQVHAVIGRVDGLDAAGRVVGASLGPAGGNAQALLAAVTAWCFVHHG